MVDNCKHVAKIKPGLELGILSPENWQCSICGTTESVWACLFCSNVACGRFNEEHALKHYSDTGHSLCIEVNEKFVFCYDCDDYILNDNAPSDIKLLRMALDAVAEQNFDPLRENEKGRRILRSHHAASANRSRRLLKADLVHTALFKHRTSLLSWVLRCWYRKWRRRKFPDLVEGKPSPGPKRKNSSLIKLGTTGLRNLGNTCYMNSVLQILCHTADFASYVINHAPHEVPNSSNAAAAAAAAAAASGGLLSAPGGAFFTRQSTTECLEQVEAASGSSDSAVSSSAAAAAAVAGGFLNGGSSSLKATEALTYADHPPTSLYEALHALLRVLWSGKRAVVSPHGLLADVWLSMPGFKGYKQQDAQEFFCELLDRLQGELHEWNPSIQDFITRTFQGELLSVVQCSRCSHQRCSQEPFLDLSLAFPPACHRGEQDSCSLHDMLDLFSRGCADSEAEGEAGEATDDGDSGPELTYECEVCNRGRAADQPVRYTEVRQTLRVNRLPRVLRLHLKRFKWCGRQREKLGCRINFPLRLDARTLCAPSVAAEPSSEFQLIGAIVHHGRGFMSGHYTAYCLNDATDSWIHCNDAKVTHVSPEEVLASQAYILVYSRLRAPLSTTPNRRRPALPLAPAPRSPADGEAPGSSKRPRRRQRPLPLPAPG